MIARQWEVTWRKHPHDTQGFDMGQLREGGWEFVTVANMPNECHFVFRRRRPWAKHPLVWVRWVAILPWCLRSRWGDARLKTRARGYSGERKRRILRYPLAALVWAWPHEIGRRRPDAGWAHERGD